MKAESRTYQVEIHIAGNADDCRRACRAFCNLVGLCVSVTEQDFIYEGGSESGVMVRLIQYPKYEKSEEEIWKEGYSLARLLRDAMCQDSFLICDSEKTEWNSHRG